MAGATGTPKIATYVIGVGSDADNLDAIAAGGGTGSAFLVDTAGDANAQFLAAMNAIQHSALGCQYVIPQPTSGTLNFSEVNVVYTPGGGSAETIPNVANAAACPATGNAWYYDNPAAPRPADHPVRVDVHDRHRGHDGRGRHRARLHDRRRLRRRRLRLAVVGHVEHVTDRRGRRVARGRRIVHVAAPRAFPGGGGGVALYQLSRSSAEVLLFTALGNETPRASSKRSSPRPACACSPRVAISRTRATSCS